MLSYRPWGSTEDGIIEFESLTNETLPGALDVIRKTFFSLESVCRSVKLLEEPGAPDELIELCRDTARDGVSVVAIDVETGEVVAALFSKIQIAGNSTEKSYFERFKEQCKCKSSKALIEFMLDVDSKMDLFKHFNVNCILELMFVATLPEYSKRRIGELLISSSIEMAKELKRGKNVKIPVTIDGDDTIQNYEAIPKLITFIGTSIYTAKIGKKLGFETLLELSFDEYEYEGKTYRETLADDNKTFVLVAKRVVL